MSNYSDVQDDYIKRAGLLVCLFVGGISTVLWLVIAVISSGEESEVVSAEVTIDLSKHTQSMKDCLLLEENDKYNLSYKMKD